MNDIVKKDGKYGVELNSDSKYGLELLVTRDGNRWYGFGLDDKLIEMLQESFNEYSKQKEDAKILKSSKQESKYKCDECKDMGFLFLTPYDYERCDCNKKDKTAER